MPYIKPALVIAFLLRFMDCMRFIDLILITTRGGPAVATKTLPFYLYAKTFQEFDIGVGYLRPASQWGLGRNPEVALFL